MSAKQSNRDAFPAVAALVDDLRAELGAGVSLVWAEENGRSIGQRGPDGVRPTIQKNDRTGADNER